MAVQTFGYLALAGAYLAILLAIRFAQLRRIHGKAVPVDPISATPRPSSIHRAWA
jgi:hypothetical protein